MAVYFSYVSPLLQYPGAHAHFEHLPQTALVSFICFTILLLSPALALSVPWHLSIKSLADKGIVAVHYSWECLRRLNEARALGRSVCLDSALIRTSATNLAHRRATLITCQLCVHACVRVFLRQSPVTATLALLLSRSIACFGCSWFTFPKSVQLRGHAQHSNRVLVILN